MALHEHEVDGAAGLSRQVGLLEVGYRDLKADLARIESDRKADVARFEATMLTGMDKIGTQIASNRDKTEGEIRALREGMASRERANWPVIMGLCVGGFGVIGTITGAGYFLTSQQTQVLVQPLALRAEVLGQAMANVDRRILQIETDGREIDKALQTNDARDSRSEQDRADSRQRVDRLSEGQSAVQSRLASLESDSKEKNTQLCAIERMQNVITAYQARLDGELWDDAHAKPLPPLPAFPVGLSCAPRG